MRKVLIVCEQPSFINIYKDVIAENKDLDFEADVVCVTPYIGKHLVQSEKQAMEEIEKRMLAVVDGNCYDAVVNACDKRYQEEFDETIQRLFVNNEKQQDNELFNLKEITVYANEENAIYEKLKRI